MDKLNVAVLISGNGTNLQALIDACRDENYPARIISVISNKPEAYGLERAGQAGIPTHIVNHKNYPNRESFEDALDEVLKKSGAELVCLAGFMRVLNPEFVRKWEGRMINIHPSLLPKYKGLDTHARAIEAGDKEAGCTVHWVVPEMDAGPIILQERVPVLPGDTVAALADRVLAKEHILYPEALKMVVEGMTHRHP